MDYVRRPAAFITEALLQFLLIALQVQSFPLEDGSKIPVAPSSVTDKIVNQPSASDSHSAVDSQQVGTPVEKAAAEPSAGAAEHVLDSVTDVGKSLVVGTVKTLEAVSEAAVPDKEAPGVGFRAFVVFGVATLIAGVYFYVKLRRIKQRDEIQYGLLDDREFELRHLELSDSSSEEDVTVYTSRRNTRNPRR